MDISKLVTAQRGFFNSQQTKPYSFRIQALRDLATSIIIHERDIIDALAKDLNKSEFESFATEIGFVLGEINYAVKNLRKWMRPERHRTPMVLFGSKSSVHHEPYGVTLIMSPWNYPFQLLIAPLVGAIAAGNCIVLKPSILAPHVAAVAKKIIADVFDHKYITVLDIPNEKTDTLLEERFDYICFTGGVEFGRHVAQIAAKTLTPTTLELGGKSPCIVDRDANIEVAARRIVWGKFLNAGQTCVAPDYIMVHESVKNKLIKSLAAEITRQYGGDPKMSPDYPRIINVKHTERLAALLSYGTVAIGGEVDIAARYVAPTVLTDVNMESELMSDEIFGPILPVLEFDDIQQVVGYVNSKSKPLSLYYFTQNHAESERVLDSISSGGACINDVVIHVANTFLPFGGVGDSGMGSYHGKYSFLTFSHARAVMRSSTIINIGVKFAPYGNKVKMLKKLMK